MPRRYRPWNQPKHSILDHVEIPDDFDMHDRTKPYAKVAVVQVCKNGDRNPWPMVHRVVAECLGRDQIAGRGPWKELVEQQHDNNHQTKDRGDPQRHH
jgi:hypothetical protein